jgi:hypothetical protein
MVKRPRRGGRAAALALLEASLLTATVGCDPDPGTHAWMVCYRIYEQCREPSDERLGDLTQPQCEAFVALKPASLLERMVDCVRDHECPGVAKWCVATPVESYELGASDLRPFLRSGFAGSLKVDRRLVAAAVGQRACFKLAVLAAPRIEISIEGLSEHGGASVALEWNGRASGGGLLDDRWSEVSAAITGGQVRLGLNTVCLVHGPPIVPPRTDRRIGSTGVVSPQDITVESAGLDDGNAAAIWVAGVDRSPNQRGLNGVALDAKSGAILSTRAFDFFSQTDAGSQLVGWVSQLPPGAIVALAARDESSKLFDARATRALRAVGAAGDLHKRWRHGYALIGVKGAPVGSAVERMSLGERARVRVGGPQVRLDTVAYYGRIRINSLGRQK